MLKLLAVESDLYFQSRIATVAAQAGVDVRFCASNSLPEDLEVFGLALVDLTAGDRVVEAIRRLGTHGLTVIAFGPHLETERRKEARQAGAQRVLAKSKFVQELPSLVSSMKSSESSRPEGRDSRVTTA